MLDKLIESITGKKKCDHSKDKPTKKTWCCIDCHCIFLTEKDIEILVVMNYEN